MAQLFFTGVNISVRYLCVKARIHFQAMPYDNATCLMFHSYVGWPRTVTRADSVGRNTTMGECHSFTVSQRWGCINAMHYFHWYRVPLIGSEQTSDTDTRQWLRKHVYIAISTHPIRHCLTANPDRVSGPLTVNSPLYTRIKQDQSFNRIILFVFAVNGIFPIPRSHRSLVPLNGENIGLHMYLD